MLSMLKVLEIVMLCFFLHAGDSAVSTLLKNGCQNANAVTDKILPTANSLMISHNYATVDIEDLYLDLPVKIFGWSIPLNVTLRAGTGLLEFGNMSRAGNSMGCTTEDSSILYTGIAYDHARFGYYDATVQVLYWEVDGQLSYEFRPSVNVTLAKDSTLGCRVVSSPIHLLKDPNYEYQSKSWVFGWFFRLLLLHAIWYVDTPMTDYFQQASYSLIGTVFAEQWCASC